MSAIADTRYTVEVRAILILGCKAQCLVKSIFNLNQTQMIKKFPNGPCCIAMVLFIGLLTSCEKENIQKELEPNTVKVETINGLNDPVFLDLVQPFTVKHAAGRVLNSSDYQSVEKVTGIDYTNYTLPIEKLNNTPFTSHSLILSVRDDTVHYNLLEVVPDKTWNGKMEDFTGQINTYLIEFDEGSDNTSGRVMNKTRHIDCRKFVIDRIVVHAGLSATAYGHWDHDDNCSGSGGGGSSGGGSYYWLPNWDSGDSGNWEDGDLSGSGGSGRSGSGSITDSRAPKYEEVPIAIEELFMAQLTSVLEDDPFALMDIDCDQIKNWKSLAQLIPFQGVIDKLNAVDNNTIGDIDVQSITDASGAVVNMDYFPVTISKLPNNPNTNKPYTAPQFLNHIRTNINDFIDTQYSEFSPSTITGFNEAVLWASNNPVGAIIHINIPKAGDGSVICSDYSISNWVFTTIEVPYNLFVQGYDGKHPVSGNREFGFVVNSDGSYTFYTRGVDRITTQVDALVAENVFSDAFADPDKLWNSLKEGIYKYVQDNGGTECNQVNQIIRYLVPIGKI